MFDLKELTRYVEITDKGLKFPHDEPRKIRLEVLAEKEVSLFVKDGKDDPCYIGTFRGYDVVQFNVRKAVLLQADGPGCKVFTTELQSDVIELPDAVSFTRTMTRRQRNPELERMELTMRNNMERRLQQVARDVTLAVSKRTREEYAELERERFERASAEEAERVADSELAAEDEGADEPAAGQPPVKPAPNVSGSRGKAPRQDVAPKPKAQG